MCPSDWDPQGFIEHLAAGWRLGDAEAFIAHFRPVIDADVTSQQPLSSELLKGRSALEDEFRILFALLPGATAKILRWSATAPDVFVEFIVTVSSCDEPFTLETCDRFTLSEGRITDRRVYFDPRGLLDFVTRHSQGNIAQS